MRGAGSPSLWWILSLRAPPCTAVFMAKTGVVSAHRVSRPTRGTQMQRWIIAAPAPHHSGHGGEWLPECPVYFGDVHCRTRTGVPPKSKEGRNLSPSWTCKARYCPPRCRAVKGGRRIGGIGGITPPTPLLSHMILENW